jgi:Histidine kinase-, DNA gyrase B-, and HSP90-like ATPase
MMSQYIFDNAAPQAGQRFASLQTLYDHWTIRHLETTGVGPGWLCWEVGAGGGSIARWLAERNSTTVGSGLGLAIAKTLVEVQKGTIEVENIPEGGACFSLRFPYNHNVGSVATLASLMIHTRAAD